MRVVVQKFGGTSLDTPERRREAARRVRAALEAGVRPVVVVSAMGRAGDPYATDTLLGLVGEARRQLSGRDVDLLLACGEVIAAVVFAAELTGWGLQPAVLTGGQAGIVTDGDHQDAAIVRVEPDAVRALLETGRVPVVAGFQGTSEDGEVTTLGRGGSDTTAVALGAALGAEAVEIYKDVAGVMTADPRLVPEARRIDHLDYEETFELAHLGATVIHPRAVEMARRFHLPVRVRSTFADDPGTLIADRPACPDRWAHRRSDRAVVGITQRSPLAQVRVEAEEELPELDVRLFRAFADAGVSVDVINVFPTQKSFVVEEHLGSLAEALLAQLARELPVRGAVVPGLAKVSVVGSAIHGLPGVMAHVAEALQSAGVRILASADSHLSISCLIEAGALSVAVRALHERFALGRAEDGPDAAGARQAAQPQPEAGARGAGL